MGPFFYSKKDIPANSGLPKSLRFRKFFLEIPPNTIILFLVKFESSLNLFKPKKFLFFLNSDDNTIFLTFWISLTFISLKLWADPIISKSTAVEYDKW